MSPIPRPDDERVLRLVLAGVAIVTVGAVAVTEILRTGSLSAGVLAILAGPVALAISAAYLTRTNGGGPK